MGCALQAPKSCCEIGRGLSSYNSISRASRSFPRSSNLPVGEGWESFKKFADYSHFVRLVPAKYSSSLVVRCICFVNSHTSSPQCRIEKMSKNISEKLLNFLAAFLFLIPAESNNDILHDEIKMGIIQILNILNISSKSNIKYTFLFQISNIFLFLFIY